ncbi:hypothetical protein F4604DRAFT_1884455 [Suillus subluteus]|nr:hypothetical protein F4604DRAFT_1884455 [Suillus subluteus]
MIIHWLDFNDCFLAAEYNLGVQGQPLTVHDILKGMIKAHEIQVGLDRIMLVKVASTPNLCKGLSHSQMIDAVSQAWNGEFGLPSVLTAKTWGFYDVLFKGRPFQMPFSSYIIENMLFKIPYPTEFHAQSAQLKATCSWVTAKPCNQLHGCIPIIFGELTSNLYSNSSAADRILIPILMHYTTKFTAWRTTLLIELNDGLVLREIEVEYPVGHKHCHKDGIPLLMEKFKRHISIHFDKAHQQKILATITDTRLLSKLPVDKFTDLFVKP